MIFTPKSRKSAKNKAFHRPNHTRGNAMIYVLLALALFGVLTATLSGQSNDADSQNIDDEQVIFYTNELIEYAAASKNVIDQMIMTGSAINDLDFINPSSAPFDIAPHVNKAYHPEGGGLNYLARPSQNVGASSAWHIQQNINVEWTPSTATDVLLTASDIAQEICESINAKLLGLDAIPLLNSAAADYFIDNGTNTNLTVTDCADCEGYASLCTEDSAGIFSFYTILAAR